ncbi:MAG: ATP-binding cassette domain-containing protein [Alcanivoracaceae bacterium]|nr:ATP-binding cassette domain-containing protein [Alcanivoracaceae bacterium]
MSLINLRNIHLSFGADPLFDDLSLAIEPGERLCLVGRNGTGKSTLMKLIAGEIQADDGDIECRQGLRVARLVQDVPADTHGSVFDVVAAGLGKEGELLTRFTSLSQQLDGADEQTLAQFEAVQQQIEAAGAWDVSQRVDTVLSRLSLDGSQSFAGLSGGMKRRVLLAQALVQAPDLLLLDEPTNHLDMESIQWLEEFLRGSNLTLLFITHDRAFLRTLATRIIELDRGQLTSWPGSYDKYLSGKQAQLEAEEKANAEFDRKLSREEAWIRQGIKARRTRNEGRVRALKKMREQFAQRRQRMGTAKLDMQEATRSGKLVIKAEHLDYTVEGKALVKDFSITVMRGDRIGIIGPNGCGKSTLIRLLLGKLAPDAGSVALGTNLEVAYFDQLRDALDESRTVMENVVEGSDFITRNGQSVHVMSYLQDFLFEPARARQPVSALSGGERNRLLLARLFTRAFNVLVLDEPTNDLDAETLELLEDQLMEYQGTLLLVSHDRDFLDNVVTSTIVFEQGTINQYVGGYKDWLRQRPAAAAPGERSTRNAPATPKPAPAAKPAKLSYKDKRELEELPALIESLESEIAALHETLGNPDFFRDSPADVISNTTETLQQREQALEQAYQRWSELEP